MRKKYKIRLTESQLTDLIIKGMIDSIMGSKGEDKVSSSDFSKSTNVESLKTSGEFTPLDLNTPEGYDAYKQIANKFISTRSSNLLGINGSMMADAAKNAMNAHNKYVPVELALAQLASEGGFSSNPNARPIKTKNPFNVGNVDSGANVYESSVQNGIQKYYDLIAKNYLTGGKTASDLLNNFVNKNGNRYATARGYESSVSKIANQVRSMGEPIYASLSKKKISDIA